ncbi:unnamed protein product [Urochloa decumbens]|uniref:DEAD-box ATP-dependent RNA helicase 10 n=1 Tax=Urochloa decumbens TaxID=240449 RepID=A0ABC9GQZ2_9POAL
MTAAAEVVAGADDEQAPPAARQASTFAELGICPELLDACDAMGWKAPTGIQAEAIPHALQGRDVIALAQTGSGKTAAFALPILQALLQRPQSFFACVLSPTRELAIQIAEQFQALGSSLGLICSVLVGGVDRMQQAISLAKRPHIVVGTPGCLLDHLTNTKGFSLNKIKYLVLDEADVLLNMEFEKALDDIIKVVPKERRTFLFSATMTKKVKKLQRACLRNPIKVDVDSKYSTVDTLRQEFYFVPGDDKDCYLVHILNKMPGSTFMIFLRNRYSVKLLALMLRNLGLKAICIHGKMNQVQSERMQYSYMHRFGHLASRGLDVQGVDVVINYDISKNPKVYIHRVGRTARAGRSGYAVSLVSQYEVEQFLETERHLGKKISKCQADESQVKMLKECVSDSKRIALRESGGHREMRDEEEEEELEHRAYKRRRFWNKSKRR